MFGFKKTLAFLLELKDYKQDLTCFKVKWEYEISRMSTL